MLLADNFESFEEAAEQALFEAVLKVHERDYQGSPLLSSSWVVSKKFAGPGDDLWAWGVLPETGEICAVVLEQDE
jgi:hypothetical protein